MDLKCYEQQQKNKQTARLIVKHIHYINKIKK